MPESSNADEVLSRIAETLEEIEDAWSGIARQDPPPPPNVSGERMYPSQEDFITRHESGAITAFTRGHRIEIDAHGGFKIFDRRTMQLILERRGAGQ
jgi:hypothetical protein